MSHHLPGFALPASCLPLALFTSLCLAPLHGQGLSMLDVQPATAAVPTTSAALTVPTTWPPPPTPAGAGVEPSLIPPAADAGPWSPPKGRRPDIDTFSAEKRKQLADLVLAYLNADVLERHSKIVHTGAHLLHGHREIIGELEAYLTANGGAEFVPFPRWDPAKPIPVEMSVVKQIPVMGSVPPPLENLDPKKPLPEEFRSPKLDEADRYKTDADLGNAINEWHGSVHMAVGGAMGDIRVSPSTPVFWLFHAYIDDVWYQWQQSHSAPHKHDMGHMDGMDMGGK